MWNRVFLGLGILSLFFANVGAANCFQTEAGLDRSTLGIDREQSIERLKNEEFDVLVIGLGASGSGAAVDAAARGLKVAAIDAGDIAGETSSRSSKMAHGGIRYLEMAVKKADLGMLKLVRNALRERGHFFKNAPHLTKPLPFFAPSYSWYKKLELFIGVKMYDLIAGRKNVLPRSRRISKAEALKMFPNLNPKGLKGGVVYYDARFNDARLARTLATTAAEMPGNKSAIANYIKVNSFVMENGRPAGANVENVLTGEKFQVKAKVYINATGPFVDNIRAMVDPQRRPISITSSGAHIVLDSSFVDKTTGIVVPETRDGRVLFILPFEGKTLVGTTDQSAKAEFNPKVTNEQVDQILTELNSLYNVKITPDMVLSKWNGIRPLATHPNAKQKAGSTAEVARDEVIFQENGLVTITGGKWTTYREMAEQVVDLAVETGQLKPVRESNTLNLPLAGAKGYNELYARELAEGYSLPKDIANHLADSYGSRANMVADIAKGLGGPKRLAEKYPYLEAEVLFAVRYESARTPVDVLTRATRLATIDIDAAISALPKVVKIMAKMPEISWTPAEQQRQIETTINYIK